MEDDLLAAGSMVLRARRSAGGRSDAPLVIALHGAGYDARYFDAPGSSVHTMLAAEGLPLVSVTRPGYPADAQSAAVQPDFSGTASLVSLAIEDAWRRWGESRPGVVLLGHSVGSAISVHVAASPRSWPLLGLAISGVGDRPAAAPVAMFGSLPRTTLLDIPFAQCRRVFYGPDHTLDPEVLDAVSTLMVPFPATDAIEVNTSWPTDLAELASRVDVPLHYVLAELDGLWETGSERVDSVAAMFRNAPWVEARNWADTGHNIEHHSAAREYVASVAAFVRRCVG